MLRRVLRLPPRLTAWMLGWALWAGAATAHDLPYALVDLTFPAPGEARMEIRCHLPALIMGAPQGELEGSAARRFIALSDADLKAREQFAGRAFLSAVSLRAEGRLVDDLRVRFPIAADLRSDASASLSGPAPSHPLVLTARFPAGARHVDLALPAELGPAVLVVRYADGQRAVRPLRGGQTSPPVRLAGPDPLMDALQAFAQFLKSGFIHILPLGYDHILFIVALAVATPRVGALARSATVFTLAHSVTLALGALNVVVAPAWLVEPGIALSIAAVAIMTMVARPEAAPRERLVVIFLFGLLHGLGFAGALQAVGLPRGLEAVALAAFNLGIEFGQLAVAAAALACIGWWRTKPYYGPRIALPVSALIAVIGSVWTVQRIVDVTGLGPLARF